MDPLTHFMTGACLARTGFNRRTAYATLVMTLAAEAPDLDTLWGIRGPIASFQHHRGWTHTFLGLPVDAALVVGAVYLWHIWRTRSARVPKPNTPSYNLEPTTCNASPHNASPPARWPLLFTLALLALLSHLLLDWTNNYGLRPFFPFNPRWYAGSFVFIVEPVMLLLLVTGLVAPALFGLISSEVGARRERFRGRGWASFALLGILALYGLRGYERLHAEDLARAADYGNVPLLRSTVSPYPINPFRWHGVVETSNFFQTSTIDSLSDQVATTSQEDLFFKPPETPATLAAKHSHLGRAFLDWSSFPLVTQTATEPATDLPTATTTVTFRDLRFLYDTLGLHGRESPPLSGEVLLNPQNQILRQSMDNKPGH